MAAEVDVPVVAVVGGITGDPQLCQWSGEIETFNSLTLCYEAEEIRVMNWFEIPWEEGMPGRKDLESFVEDYFGFAWEDREEEIPDLTGWRLVEETDEADKIYELPKKEAEKRQRRREQAAAKAEHRVVELPLGDTCVKAIVVGEDGMWRAGFETVAKGTRLVVLISGGAVSVESLKLDLVDDLLAYLRSSG